MYICPVHTSSHRARSIRDCNIHTCALSTRMLFFGCLYVVHPLFHHYLMSGSSYQSPRRVTIKSNCPCPPSHTSYFDNHTSQHEATAKVDIPSAELGLGPAPPAVLLSPSRTLGLLCSYHIGITICHTKSINNCYTHAQFHCPPPLSDTFSLTCEVLHAKWRTA